MFIGLGQLRKCLYRRRYIESFFSRVQNGSNELQLNSFQRCQNWLVEFQILAFMAQLIGFYLVELQFYNFCVFSLLCFLLVVHHCVFIACDHCVLLLVIAIPCVFQHTFVSFWCIIMSFHCVFYAFYYNLTITAIQIKFYLALTPLQLLYLKKSKIFF